MLAVVDEDLEDGGADRRGRSPSRSATGRSSRRPMRPACASASWPRRRSTALDLRRGEIRVLGKGRKERIGLLGRPARRALQAYLEDGRPVLLDDPANGARQARHRPAAELFLNHLGDPLGVRGLGSVSSVSAWRPACRRGLAPHAAPQLRDAPARGRRRPARGPGAARAREPRHDADLHARLAGAPAGRVLAGAPARPACDADARAASQGPR